MKCLMRMHAKDNKGVLFFETIISFKQQRHTYIEAVPLPFEQFQDAPAYFRVSGVFAYAGLCWGTSFRILPQSRRFTFVSPRLVSLHPPLTPHHWC